MMCRMEPCGNLVAALAVAMIAAGCGQSGKDEDDAVLTIYVSAPLTGPARADGEDIADGARQALEDAGAEAAGLRVRAEYLDVAGRNESRFDPVTAARNARTAIEDSTSIAYIGELNSGASRTSVPITNQADLLQVAPGSGASDLVRDEPFSNDVPEEVQTTGLRTFARLVPSDEAVARAGAGWVEREGARTFLLAVFGASSEAERRADPASKAFTTEAESLGMRTIPIEPDVVFEPAPVPRSARGLSSPYGDVAGGNYLFMDSSIPVGRDLIGATSFRSSVVSHTLAATHLPAAGQDFAQRFEQKYDRAPGRYAAYGYEAMASILAAIDRASDPTDRPSVVNAYFDGAERDSVLGTYSITDTGESTLDRITGYRLTPDGTLEPIAELRIP